MAEKRYSRQRESILSYLHSVTCHPTVETIYTEVKKQIPNISLGTVYRNLSQLTEEGRILKLTIDSGAEHYDATNTPHSHMICRNCGRIEDIEDFHISGLDEKAAKLTGYKDLFHTLHFYGICPECSRKKH